MILNFPPVAFVNLSEETAKEGFIQVGIGIKVKSAHNVNSQHRQSWLTANLIYKPMDVEVNRVNLL